MFLAFFGPLILNNQMAAPLSAASLMQPWHTTCIHLRGDFATVHVSSAGIHEPPDRFLHGNHVRKGKSYLGPPLQRARLVATASKPQNQNGRCLSSIGLVPPYPESSPNPKERKGGAATMQTFDFSRDLRKGARDLSGLSIVGPSSFPFFRSLCLHMKISRGSLHRGTGHHMDKKRTPSSFNKFGCGSKPMVPFWGRCTTHLSLFYWGL